MIFAMDFEMSAFRYMLDEEYTMTFDKQPNDRNQYKLGRSGRHNVVLAWLAGEQGRGAAAMAAQDLARTFQKVEWRVLVGIGGGVPSSRHDIRLGDVVVSMPDMDRGGVVQYDLGRATDGQYQVTGFLSPPPAYLRNVVVEMKSNHLGHGNMIEHFVSELQKKHPKILREYQRPSPESDILFQDGVPHNAGADSCEGCDASRIVCRPPRDANDMTEIHYGLIASGDTVVASTAARQQIIANLGLANVLCFEMEAAGVMSGYECLVIRGISDYADSHKGEHWRRYAAAAAAACAKELLMLAIPTAAATTATTTTAATELPIPTRPRTPKLLTFGEDAGNGDDRGQFRGGNHSVGQGFVAMDNSNVKMGNVTFNNSTPAKERQSKGRRR